MTDHFYCVGRGRLILKGTASFAQEAAIRKAEIRKSVRWTILQMLGFRLWEVWSDEKKVVVTELTVESPCPTIPHASST